MLKTEKILIFLILLFFSRSFSVRGEDVVTNGNSKNGNDKIDIKSDKFEYKYKEKEEIGVFTGSVELKKGNLTVYSDEMKMYSQDKKTIAENNVKVIVDSEKEKRIITGGYLEYRRSDDYVLVNKSPKMVIINKEKNKKDSDKKKRDFKELVITSETMEMFSKENRSRAVGKVVIEEGENRAYCEEAVYYDREEKVILTGSPRIEQKENKFQGEKIIFFVNEDKIIIEGKVEGTVIEEKEKEKESQKSSAPGEKSQN